MQRIFKMTCVALFLCACTPEEPPCPVEVPPTPILTAESSWGVINEAYARVLSIREPEASVNGVLRRGEIVEILSRVGRDGGKKYWLEVRCDDLRGWVQDDFVDVHDTRAQAQTASRGHTGL